MLTEEFIDGRRRCRGDNWDKPCEDYTSGSSLISPSPLEFENDHMSFDFEPFHYEYMSSRQLLFDSVSKLNDDKCRLTTSLRTNYKGWHKASGIMFTIKPSKESLELLTLEFPTWEDYGSSSAARKIQVYYRVGSFSGVMNDSSAWTLLADTSARLISPLLPPNVNESDEIGAIVPWNEFKPVTLEPGQIYSVYIAGQSISPNPEKTLLKASSGPAVGLVGDKSAENEVLQVRTGVRLKGSSFPKTFQEAAEFNGVLHYRATKSCDDSTMFTTTSIALEFAVNQPPSDSVKGELRNATYETLSTWLITNKDLARYVEEHVLKLEGITMDFKDPDGKCPGTFADCTIVTTTVLFKHSHNLDEGRLKAEILGSSTRLETTVNTYLSPVESSYVGNPFVKAEFAITLTGVPAGAGMNAIQKNYFEEVTTSFLRDSRTTKVLNAVVNEEIPETLFKEDGHPPESRTRRYLASNRVAMLRGRRNLQDVASKGKIRIITEIAAEGSLQELRNSVLGGIGNGSAQYSRELISQQMRPISMNEKDGDFFAELTNIQVKPYVPTSGNSVPSRGNGTVTPNTTRRGGSAAVILCILLIVFSMFWLFYRVYIDCFHSPFQKPVKLNDDKDEFKDEEEVERSSAFRSPLYGLLRIPSFQGVVSDMTRDSSFGTVGNDARNRSKLTRSQKSLSSRSRSRSGSRKGSSSFDNGHGLDLSCADIESSDEESALLSPRRLLGGSKRGRLTPSLSLPIQNRSGVKNPPRIEMPQRRTSRRSSDGPKRGKLAATKSMPVQKRNASEPKTDSKKKVKGAPKTNRDDRAQRSTSRRSSDGPKRGRLTATKSMPVQKRNGLEPKTAIKKQIKGSPKATRDVKTQRSAPRRSSDEPKRGKLAATKSMPVQKRNGLEPKTDVKKQMKGAPKYTHGDKAQRSAPRRSSDAPKRGKLTPSKSSTSENRGVRRAKSMPIDKKKKQSPIKGTSLSTQSPSAQDNAEGVVSIGSILAMKKMSQENSNAKKLAKKKSDKLSSSSHSKSKKIDRRSSHSKSKNVDRRSSHSQSKKIDRRSSDSQMNKKQIAGKPRGTRPVKSKSMPVKSKSLPVQIKKRISERCESEKSIVKLADMVHGSLSDSDSSSLSENSSSTSPDLLSDSPRILHRKSSWTSDSSSKKSSDSRKSYGKAGKIQYGGAKRFLPDVAE